LRGIAEDDGRKDDGVLACEAELEIWGGRATSGMNSQENEASLVAQS
jgi:hypothetical protein